MTKARLGRIALGVVGLGIGIVAVLALREATLSTHEEVAARETDLVLSAKTKGGEPNQTLAEMVEAQLLSCRLEVESDLSGPIERVGDGRYRAVLVPALDESNRRQFRGCVEDWIIDHVQLDVLELTNIR
ncbi:MAG TPA: hypothetical protein VKB11_00500 [Acidimicrobiia bacterium]|nr:hypothetical protein [Acidimicrobiia bacterium]